MMPKRTWLVGYRWINNMPNVPNQHAPVLQKSLKEVYELINDINTEEAQKGKPAIFYFLIGEAQ